MNKYRSYCGYIIDENMKKIIRRREKYYIMRKEVMEIPIIF